MSKGHDDRHGPRPTRAQFAMLYRRHAQRLTWARSLPSLVLMDRLGIGEIERLARTAAQRHAVPVEVVSASFGGGSDYVELLVNVGGCPIPPCRFSIGVFRNESPQAVYGEIAELLGRHLAAHPPAKPQPE